MDKLPALGTAIASIIPSTVEIYMGLLKPQASAIDSTPYKTFRYGSHPRQELDIYYPSTPSIGTSSRPRVLIFLHGGGLVRGAKNLNPLVYANLGHFFASQGLTTIIPNYRLIEHGAKFPSGGEDVALVMTWLHHNLKEVSDAAHSHGIELSAMGNSAGGIHLATYLLAHHFDESRHEVSGHNSKRKIWLEKVVFLSAPFDMHDSLPDRKDVLDAYYGTRPAEDTPLGLLKVAQKPFEGLEFLILTGSLDPEDEILGSNRRFVDECKNKGLEGKMTVEVMEGHNHVSPVLAVGTGIAKDEAWGKDVVKFVSS